MKTLQKFPNKIKYKFYFKNKIKNNTIILPSLKSLKFGKFGLQSLQNTKITYKEVESVRVAITRKYKTLTKIWLRFKFVIPLSSKPAAVRMGKGKGKTSSWVCNVKKGNVVLEIDNLRENEARLVLKIAKQKLPGNFLIIRR